MPQTGTTWYTGSIGSGSASGYSTEWSGQTPAPSYTWLEYSTPPISLVSERERELGVRGHIHNEKPADKILVGRRVEDWSHINEYRSS